MPSCGHVVTPHSNAWTFLRHACGDQMLTLNMTRQPHIGFGAAWQLSANVETTSGADQVLVPSCRHKVSRHSSRQAENMILVCSNLHSSEAGIPEHSTIAADAEDDQAHAPRQLPMQASAAAA